MFCIFSTLKWNQSCGEKPACSWYLVSDCKIICLFWLFFSFSWKGGRADRKPQKPRIGKMLTSCETPHCPVTLVCQAGQVRLPGAGISCLLMCPNSCPHIELPGGNGWSQGRVKSRQKSCAIWAVKRWSDIAAIATLFSKTYWWQDFKSRRQVTAF